MADNEYLKRNPDERRFKVVKNFVLGTELPVGGNCIQVRQAQGTLTITTNKGDKDELVQDEVVRFDNPFTSIIVRSTVNPDNVILSVGYGLKITPRGGAGGGGSVASGCCPAVVVAEYRQPTGTPGGIAVQNAWTTYPLNTFAINDNGLGSFNAINVNDIDLPAGVYEIRGGTAGIVHFLDCDIRVIRPDTGAVLCQGFAQFNRTDANPDKGQVYQYPTLTLARFTLNDLTSIRMEYFVDELQAVGPDPNDLGYPLNGLVPYGLDHELYGNLWIAKIG